MQPREAGCKLGRRGKSGVYKMGSSEYAGRINKVQELRDSNPCLSNTDIPRSSGVDKATTHRIRTKVLRGRQLLRNMGNSGPSAGSPG